MRTKLRRVSIVKLRNLCIVRPYPPAVPRQRREPLLTPHWTMNGLFHHRKIPSHVATVRLIASSSRDVGQRPVFKLSTNVVEPVELGWATRQQTRWIVMFQDAPVSESVR